MGAKEHPITFRRRLFADRLYKRMLKCTGLPFVYFDPIKGEGGILQSKIGGAYYVPEGTDAPLNEQTGRALYLLAQLNFAELPHLDGWPERGLLQFFVAGDDPALGCDFEIPYDQQCWKIRYLEDLPEADAIPAERIFQPPWPDNEFLPFTESARYTLKGVKGVQVMPKEDIYFTPVVTDHCRDILPEDVDNFYQVGLDVVYYVEDKIKLHDGQFGGHPYFIERDPRKGKQDPPDVLLFQLKDNGDDMTWCDGGVGNFFIKKSDLERKDFSHVWFNWDCGY